MIDVDIPQLSSNGIQFGCGCFKFAYSLQSSSTLSPISSSLDAIGLENYINYGNQTPSPIGHVVRNQTELNSIPLDVKDLWISRFDTSEVSEFSPSRFQSLKALVIGGSVLWSVTKLELNNLPSLQSIEICGYCFHHTSSFSLNGLIDGLA